MFGWILVKFLTDTDPFPLPRFIFSTVWRLNFEEVCWLSGEGGVTVVLGVSSQHGTAAAWRQGARYADSLPRGRRYQCRLLGNPPWTPVQRCMITTIRYTAATKRFLCGTPSYSNLDNRRSCQRCFYTNAFLFVAAASHYFCLQYWFIWPSVN